MASSLNRSLTDLLWMGAALALAVVVTLGVLVAPMGPLLPALLVIGLPVLVKRPEVALTVIALTLPAGSTTPEWRIDSPIGQFTPFQLTVFLTAGIHLALNPTRFVRGVRSPLGALGGILVATSLLSALNATHSGALYWVLNMGGILVALAGALGQRFREDPDSVTRWVVVAAALNGVVMVVEYLTQAHVTWLPGIAPPSDAIQMRPDGLTGNALVAGASAAVALAVALTARNNAILRFGAAGALTAGALLSLSRTAVVAVAVAALGYVFFNRVNRKGKWLVALVGGPAAAYLAASQLGNLGNRLGGASFANSSDGVRTHNLQAAWDFFADHAVTGAGLGGFKAAALGEAGRNTAVATVDNMFLTLLVDLGVVGALALVVWGCVAFLRHRGRGGTLLPLMTLFAASLFFDSFFHDPVLLLLAVSVMVASGPSTAPGATVESVSGAESSARSPRAEPIPGRAR